IRCTCRVSIGSTGGRRTSPVALLLVVIFELVVIAKVIGVGALFEIVGILVGLRRIRIGTRRHKTS
ncbi:MAG: hypothetical protein WBP75_11000, partial [Candidatus Cybelea sp.]